MVKLNCSKIAKFVFILLITPLFVVAYFSSQKAQAQMPSTINFQGKIVRNDSGYEGMNVTTGSPACVQAGADTCDFQVKYYSASSGGTLFLTETFVDKEIGQYGGVFELSLGSGSITAGLYSTLDEVIQKENTIYIEIGFSPAGNSTFTETFTRMYLQANAFAIRSKYSEMAKGAFKFENAPNSSGYSGSDGMVYYDTTTGGLKLYSAGVWLDISTGTSSSLWGTDSISSYSHNPSQFLETSGIATLSNFGLDTTVNRAWIHGASSRTGFSVYSNYGGATDWPLVTFKADASNFGNSILQLIQDGTGSILEGYKGTNKVFDIDNRGDMHLSSDGILYFEPFSSLPSSGNLFPGSGEGCLYSAGGNIYWDSGCDASSPTMLNAISSSLWTDAGSFTYLTSTGDNLVLGGNSVATATFFFDMTGTSGRYFKVDNYNNTETLFTIDSSGNVGIGTATPGAKLDIGGSSANISNAIGDITIIPAQNLIISQGNVGIGTASPTSLLSVGSTSQFQVDANGDLVRIKNLTYSWPASHTTGGLLSNNGSGTLTWTTLAGLGAASGTGVAGQVTFWSGTSTIAGDNNLWWDNINKRLGIGTTTPQATIDIAGATSEIANTSGNISIIPAQNLVITQGNVGIGVSSPSSKFHVRWSDTGCGSQCFSDSAIFENNGNVFIQLMGSSSGEKSINFAKPTAGADGAIKYNHSQVANGFSFWTNGNNFRMALDANGNLGIGISSPGYKLDVDGTVMARGTGSSRGFRLDGGNTKIYTDGSNGAIRMLPGNGWFAVRDSTDTIDTLLVSSTYTRVYSKLGVGTAPIISLAIGDNDTGFNWISDGNFAVYTNNAERMRFASNGSVGIGTVSPSQKLDVNGNIQGYRLFVSGLSTSWGSTNGINTGGVNVTMGTGSGATWLISGTSSSVFRSGIQSLDSNGELRLYSNSSYITVSGSSIYSGYLYSSGQIYSIGNIFIQNVSPTIFLRDTDNRSSMIHVNSNLFYVLRGCGTDSTSWCTYNGYWPMELNLENNEATFGGRVTSASSMNPQIFFNISNTEWNSINNGISMGVNGITSGKPSYYTSIILKENSNRGFEFAGFYGSSSTFYGKTKYDLGGWNAWVQFTTTNWSDQNLKKNITPIDDALSKISLLKGYYFDWRADEYPGFGFDNQRQIGLIAQEVEKVFPQLVTIDPNGFKTLDYRTLVALLIQGVNDQQKMINSLRENISYINNNYNNSLNKFYKITESGWYRLYQITDNDINSKLKINNSTLGSLQNLVLEIDVEEGIYVIKTLYNFSTGGYNISKARINNVNGDNFIEVYFDKVNNNILHLGDNNYKENLIITKVERSDIYNGYIEYNLDFIAFGISNTLVMDGDSLSTSGKLLTSGMFSDIGNSNNRWNDIYTKGTIRLGSGNSEGGIRYNVEKKRLEFSNDGINWVEMGDLTSNVVISPEYSGAILYADGSDNHGRMTSDAINTGGVFKNYYEWRSDRETLQDYDILVRITLPSDFVSWKEDAISLDFMTENSASIANNKVEIALIGDSGIDSEIKNGISKMPGSWERISIKAVDITQCKKAGESCTLRLSMYSKENYYVRVGDISLNYNRGL